MEHEARGGLRTSTQTRAERGTRTKLLISSGSIDAFHGTGSPSETRQQVRGHGLGRFKDNTTAAEHAGSIAGEAWLSLKECQYQG
ncbi:hypothetical protein EYF80_054286 [Liparis tanakae]|uniref:Uncharacterized protein n=1 Tax=Liparis tanakae TaxID=230148 RepID=A0A4Z2F3B2_9TELE|nr:hypothetical protein EYF80_054286 [Liparis tanakae]